MEHGFTKLAIKNGTGGTRTHGQPVMSRLLWPLSYRPSGLLCHQFSDLIHLFTDLGLNQPLVGDGAIALVLKVIDRDDLGRFRSGFPRACQVLFYVQHAVHATGFVVAATLEKENAENGTVGGFDLLDEFCS
jgi:hypothetical protein